MEKQKLIELLRDAYLTGVKEKTFADQINWLDYDYEAMGGAYAGAVVNNSVLDDVIVSERECSFTGKKCECYCKGECIKNHD